MPLFWSYVKFLSPIFMRKYDDTGKACNRSAFPVTSLPLPGLFRESPSGNSLSSVRKLTQ